MPRFVVLHHQLPDGTSHFDWMFESEPAGSLETWAVADATFAPEAVRSNCRKLAFHRREYLDYEGPISDNRGTVSRWDQGTFERIAAGLGRFRAAVYGERWRGIVEFVEGEDGNWTHYFRQDSLSSGN